MAQKASRLSYYWVPEQDLIQEGTIACWQWCEKQGLSWEALSKEDSSPYHALLNTIARRAMLEVCRRERRHWHDDLKDWDAIAPEQEETTDSLLNKINGVMKHLSKKKRLVLSDLLMGKSGKSTAGELGVSGIQVSRLGQKAIEEIKLWLHLQQNASLDMWRQQGRSLRQARTAQTLAHQRALWS